MYNKNCEVVLKFFFQATEENPMCLAELHSEHVLFWHILMYIVYISNLFLFCYKFIHLKIGSRINCCLTSFYSFKIKLLIIFHCFINTLSECLCSSFLGLKVINIFSQCSSKKMKRAGRRVGHFVHSGQGRAHFIENKLCNL